MGIGNVFAKAKQKMQGLDRILWTLGLGSVFVLLGLTYWIGELHYLTSSRWVRVLVALFVGGGIFSGFKFGLPRWRERKFVKQEKSQYVAAGEESPEEARARFAKALQKLKELPRLKDHAQPVYALPWYLLIGAAGSGKTAAIQASELFTPLFPVTDGPTTNYEFWLSNNALFLDTPGRYSTHDDADRDRQEWYRLLRLLHHHRAQEPINGLLVALPADWLASQSEEQLRAAASKLRERVEETVRELGVDVPLFFVVTKCDLIEGFAEFFGGLPERVRQEALGFVDDPGADDKSGGRGAQALDRFRAGLKAIGERLHLFRLSILSSKAPEALRKAVFCFPEEFDGLEKPLTTFLDPIFSEDVRFHTPRLRGVFFASAAQGEARFSLLRSQLNLGTDALPAQASNRRHFLNDLFDIMIPRDRGLITTTTREKRRKGVGRATKVVLTAGLLLLSVGFVARAYFVDRRIAGSVDSASCPSASATGEFSRQRLAAADSCRRAAQQVEEQNLGRSDWTAWFNRRSASLEKDLRDRFLAFFADDVLAPLDARLDESFQNIGDPLPLMLLVAQRIQLNRRCLSPGGCSSKAVLEFPLDYATMIDPTGKDEPKKEEVENLRQTFAAYVLWQEEPRAKLHKELAADQDRLKEWLTTKSFSLDNLMPLVNKRSPPTLFEDYWQMPAPITTVGAPIIESACTRKTWEQEIAPLLQQIQDAVPEADEQLRAFRQQYLATCFGQWQAFLASFSQGAERWRGADRQRKLTLRLVSEDSPYRRVLEDAASNLSAWLPSGKPDPELAWAIELSRYAASERRKTYEAAMTSIGAQLDAKPLPEACLDLTKSTFADGNVSQDSTSPILRAWALAGPVAADEAEPEANTILASLLRDPVQYVWRFALETAAGQLQEEWVANVVTPLADLPAADQVVLLYGPGGKLGTFVTESIQPFLVKDSEQPGTVLGEQLPLSVNFLQVLDNGRNLQPVFDGSQPPQPIEVTAPHRSDIHGKGTLREERTVLQLVCGGKTYRVTTRPVEESERSATVPWSFQTCGDVKIGVYFSSTGASSGRYELSKVYGGQKGFIHFLADFREGVAEFALDDFDADPDQWNVLKFLVTSVTVYFSAELPPGMEQLTTALAETTPPDLIETTSPI